MSFVANFQYSWLQLHWELMSHYNSRRVWLTILHDRPSKKLICVGNSEMPLRHSVVGSFSLFLRDSKDYSDSPQSLRKDTMQTSEQYLMSVFSAGQPSDLGALVFFTIILKCRCCQKIASHPCRTTRWWGWIGWGDTVCDDGSVWKAITELLSLCPKHLSLSALQKPLRNQGAQNNLSCETFPNVTLQLLFFQPGLNFCGAKRAKRSAVECKPREGKDPSFFLIW